MFPYDDYSWPLSQHMGKIKNIDVLLTLLRAADLFRHCSKSQATYEINNYLNKVGLIPENKRADSNQSDIWRDYQQVLPELGLMESTRQTSNPILTNLGLLLLDGEVSFESMVTNQALKYQYPNGFKLQLPKGIKEKKRVKNRAFLDDSYGIRIKPGVLILRILLEIMKDNEIKIKSLDSLEVVRVLMPLRKNSEWRSALLKLKDIRRGGRDILSIPKLSSKKRHVQEWFRFLSYGSIFELHDGRILLNNGISDKQLEELEELCRRNEAPGSFWEPDSFDQSRGLGSSWFEYYGNINAIWSNSIIDEGLDSLNSITSGNINLRKVNIEEKNFKPRHHNFQKSGHDKYRESSLLHDKMVNEMKVLIESKGFETFEDPNSIDLLGINTLKDILFEVKTIGEKDFWVRIRLGVGQVLEYRYRYANQNKDRNTSCNIETYLLINGNIIFPEWFHKYFEEELRIGLIQRVSEGSFIVVCDPFDNIELFQD